MTPQLHINFIDLGSQQSDRDIGWCIFLSGRRSGLMVIVLDADRAVRVRVPAGDTVLCTWTRHVTHTVSLSPCDGLACHPGGGGGGESINTPSRFILNNTFSVCVNLLHPLICCFSLSVNYYFIRFPYPWPKNSQYHSWALLTFTSFLWQQKNFENLMRSCVL